MLTKSLLALLFLFNPFTFLIPPAASEITSGESNGTHPAKAASDDRSGSGFLGSALQLANPNFLPIRDWGVAEPDIEAQAAIIYIHRHAGPLAVGFESKELRSDNILYQRNVDAVYPIASLTKLMTAIAVIENMALEDVAEVAETALAKGYGERGGLVEGERISVEKLLYALLMESSNDAALVLSEHYDGRYSVDGRSFMGLMNEKARELGLSNTYFADPSGYKPANLSTAKELVRLIEHSFRHPIIWQIMRTPEIELISKSGQVHLWRNTDKLLTKMSGIVGGKTGYTSEAGECFIFVIERQQEAEFPLCQFLPKQSEYIIAVILGAQDKFSQTEKLINWAEEAYRW